MLPTVPNPHVSYSQDSTRKHPRSSSALPTPSLSAGVLPSVQSLLPPPSGYYLQQHPPYGTAQTAAASAWLPFLPMYYNGMPPPLFQGSAPSSSLEGGASSPNSGPGYNRAVFIAAKPGGGNEYALLNNGYYPAYPYPPPAGPPPPPQYMMSCPPEYLTNMSSAKYPPALPHRQSYQDNREGISLGSPLSLTRLNSTTTTQRSTPSSSAIAMVGGGGGGLVKDLSPSSSSCSSPSCLVEQPPPITTAAAATAKNEKPPVSARSSRVKPPPRPPNAFILYRRDRQRQIRETYPDWTVQQVSRRVGELWHGEEESVKKHYRDLAAKVKVEHGEMFPDYKYQPRPPKKKRKLLQQWRAMAKATLEAATTPAPMEEEEMGTGTGN